MNDFDVIVLGSGASALAAAVAAHGFGAARVGVFEKADVVGGTSAMSGGMIWVPCNPHMQASDTPDSRSDALRYLDSLSHDRIVPELAEAYVDIGPEMVGWFEEHTPVIFEIVENFPDYHPEHPGGSIAGGRSLECPLYSFSELGEWQDRVAQSRQMGRHVLMNETTLGRGATTGISTDLLAQRERDDERGCGQALIGRLLRACLDRGIEPRTGHRAVGLDVLDGRVSGVRFETADGPVEATASRGVILATGGFEWNPEMIRSFIRGPLERPVSIETNTGDGLTMAMRVGASLGNMQEAWWVPVIDVENEAGETIPWMVNRERVQPRCIMVNRAGRRFANEASNYNAFGAAFHQLDPGTFEYSNMPAWMVFDHQYLTTSGIARYRGEGAIPDWLNSAPTLRDLADEIGADGPQLEETVARWNAQVADLDDPDFGRGRSVNDTHWGDGTRTTAATLGPLDQAPYYAVQVRPGALGTKGGPRTNAHAQVLDLDGHVIKGLYAAGNVMASAMGMTYGGAGGTLGPGMVFGFEAGRHAARSDRVDIPNSHDELTAAWLTDVLGERRPGLTVESFERRAMGEGVGMMATLELVDVDGGERGAETVVVKLKATSDTNRAVALAFDIYRREVLFYRDIAARTEIGTPEVLLADVQGSEDFVLVLEDLSAYRLGDQVSGCSVEDARTAMVGLARLHAPFWNDVDHDALDFIPYETPSTHGDALRDGAAVGWDATVAAFPDAVPDEMRAVKDRFLAAIPALQEWLVTAPSTIAHGDFRMDNLFFGTEPDHQPMVVIDWQGCLRTKGVRDVAYLLSQSMPTEQRRRSERDLVELWRQTLVDGGVSGYGAEQAWEDYRRAVLALWTLVVVIAGTLDSSNERGRAWMTEMIRRSAATIADLDLLDLLPEFEH